MQNNTYILPTIFYALLLYISVYSVLSVLLKTLQFYSLFFRITDLFHMTQLFFRTVLSWGTIVTENGKLKMKLLDSTGNEIQNNSYSI
jgi:hypothetical protein